MNDRLTALQQQAYDLACSGKSIGEIATLLGVTPGRVSDRVRQAEMKLGRRLKRRGPGNPGGPRVKRPTLTHDEARSRLGELPRDWRPVIERVLEGHGLVAIGDELGLSQSTVSKRVTQSEKLLGARLPRRGRGQWVTPRTDDETAGCRPQDLVPCGNCGGRGHEAKDCDLDILVFAISRPGAGPNMPRGPA